VILSAADAIEKATASVDPTDQASIARALSEVEVAMVEEVMHASSDATGELVGIGLGASAGRAVGIVVRSVDEALAAYDRGDPVVFVSVETSPVDEPALHVAAAVVTARGGLASHAAVLARDLGIPAVCGFAEVAALVDGESILVDGRTGEVRVVDGGANDDAPAPEELPTALSTLLDWADDVAAPRLEVRANVDLAPSARRARRFGAKGVGLCRIEHVFLGNRVAILRQAARGDAAARAEIGELLRNELIDLLGEMDGLPVVVRMLDAPAHEFGEGTEHNPMLGLRGVRAAIVDEPLARAQLQAIADAVTARRAAGGRPLVEVLVPLVSLPAELELVGGWVREVTGLPVGVMVETPRAALAADRLAPLVESFSFGTNDLTQLTYGWSRDDLDGQLLPTYRDRGIVDVSPFETLDAGAVVRLMALAVETGRAANPDLRVGLCGEQAAEPRSIEIALQLGLDHVSCAPGRVPVARLAAAQAVLATHATAGGPLGGRH
jgi:pyruvate,orthophosphate dikinase